MRKRPGACSMTEQQKQKCVYVYFGCRCRNKILWQIETGELLCKQHFRKWLDAYGGEVTTTSNEDGIVTVTT